MTDKTAPAGELTDEDIYDCLPLGVAEFSVVCGPSEIRTFARAVIAADRALRASHAGDVAMPVVAYLRATPDGEPVWAEDCVCQDAIWPMEDEYGNDPLDVSMAMVKQSDAQAALAAKDVEIERLGNVSIMQSQIIDRLQRSNADYSMNMREANTEIIDLRKRIKSPTQVEIVALTAERDALLKERKNAKALLVEVYAMLPEQAAAARQTISRKTGPWFAFGVDRSNDGPGAIDAAMAKDTK